VNIVRIPFKEFDMILALVAIVCSKTEQAGLFSSSGYFVQRKAERAGAQLGMILITPVKFG
jgi:ABC-type transport system involved in cytochrome bd biosynthesis fused ATPase/permease subunit